MPEPQPAAPSDNDTLTSVLQAYVDNGYAANMTVTDDGLLRCPTCRNEVPPDNTCLHALRRMEGASDPADMLAVLALECPKCGALGTAVVHYGPDSTEGEVTVLLAVEGSTRPQSLDEQ
jgi:hypothetical protein